MPGTSTPHIMRVTTNNGLTTTELPHLNGYQPQPPRVCVAVGAKSKWCLNIFHQLYIRLSVLQPLNTNIV